MIVGFIGSGNMAAAMARGLAGEVGGMLFADSGSGRAERLASELAGEALAPAAVAARAELLVLAVKPAAMGAVAAELGGYQGPLVSLLGATSRQAVADAFPGADVCRAMPNVAVEVRRGTICVSGCSPQTRELLALLGRVVEVADADFDAATAVMGCAPAYFARVAGALTAAGARAGLDPELSRELVTETAIGTGLLLESRSPREISSAVASPGGSTEAGLEALDREGLDAALEAAVTASLERMRGA